MSTIWVDADACPVVIKDILFRAARRTGVAVRLVANHFMAVPKIPSVQLLQVSAGFDVADNLIAQQAQPGDLVITSDIPLAAEVVDKGVLAISPRGEHHSPDTIRQRLNMRDFLETMRSSGVEVGGGPPKLNQADRQAFAAHLDRFLARLTS
ncbi:MAG: YaiI/YqxD family protein [Pseudomonadota bacterium]|nr:YaiI/YqxD family protein [Pseudomonadota bacterium]